MKATTIVVIGMGLLLAASFLVALRADTLSWESVGSGLILGVGYFGGYAYMRYVAALRERQNQHRKTIEYCWKKLNERLISMPGGDALVWEGGKGRESTIRRFADKAGKLHEFRSFYGFLERARQNVVAIWDVENEDVARYVASPPGTVLEDPFHEFKPFDTGGWETDLRKLDLLRRRDRRRGVSVRLPGGGYPTSDYVDSAINPFDETRKDSGGGGG